MAESRDRSVKVAELKARLSAYLKHVRRGKNVVVCDRDTPIARLVPYDAAPATLPSRAPRGRLRDVRLPPPLGRDVGGAAALADERQSDR